MFAVYIQGGKHTRVESVIRFIMKGAYGVSGGGFDIHYSGAPVGLSAITSIMSVSSFTTADILS
jgi:hypothetical protein